MKVFVLETTDQIHEVAVVGKGVDWVFYTLAPERLDRFTLREVEEKDEPPPGRVWFGVNRVTGKVTKLWKVGDAEPERS